MIKTKKDIERYIETQTNENCCYAQVLQEMKAVARFGHWIRYMMKKDAEGH